MTPMSIREYAEAMRRGYLGAGRREKGRLLTDFCKITGYHRDSAIRLLNKAPVPTAGRRGRPREYSVGVAEALRRLWETVHRICSKNLEGLIPTLLESMEAHGEIDLSPEVKSQLLRLKSATIDRLLRPYRRSTLRKPWGSSRSSSAIKALVPIRSFGEWKGVEAGSFQMDLVAHCGESTEGFYLNSLMAVDVATGWSEMRVGGARARIGWAGQRIG